MPIGSIEFSLVDKNVDTLGPSLEKWNKSDFPYQNAGLDLYAKNPVIGFVHKSQIEVGINQYIINAPIVLNAYTNIRVNLPPGIHMLVAGRSGLSFNGYMHPFYGVIDSSYLGEIVTRLYVDYRISANFDAMDRSLFHNSPDGIFMHSSLTKLPFDLYLVTYKNTPPDIHESKEYYKIAEEFVKERVEFEEIVSGPITNTAIAQLVFLNYAGIDLGSLSIDIVDKFSENNNIRGDKGFGSTG